MSQQVDKMSRTYDVDGLVNFDEATNERIH